MADIATIPISAAKIRMNWREKYLTDAENEKSLAIPRGIYRGYLLASTAVPDQVLNLRIDPGGIGVDVDQFAVYRDRTNGYALSIRESTDVALDLSALFPVVGEQTWWIYISATYAHYGATTGQYGVADSDPRAVNPNALVLGTVAMHNGNVVFNSAVNAISYTQRTYPIPTARELLADFVAGDEAYGLLDGLSYWRVPSYNQKEALNHAPHAPTAANPLVTVADLSPTSDKIVAEPRIITVTGDGTNVVDFDAAIYDPFYIGKGGAGTPKDWFFVSVSQSNVPFHVDQRLIRVGDVQDLVTHASLNGIGDADANGFYVSPVPPPPPAGTRLTFVYEDGSAAVLPLGIDVDIWCQQKVLLHDLDETPAAALPVAMRPQRSHADEIMARRYLYPPNLPQASAFTAGDAIRKLQEQERGHLHYAMTDAEVCARGFWTSQDGHMFSGQNTIALPDADAYIALQAARYLDSRYLLVLVNVAGGGGSWIYKINVVTGAMVTYNVAASLDPAGTWYATDMCCNGSQFFVRFYCTAGATINEHRVLGFWVSTGTVIGAWPAGGRLIGTGTGPFDFSEVDPNTWAYAQLIVADETTLAANLNWNELSAAAVDGVMTISMANGAIVGHGSGDFGGIAHATMYAAGPMCSDKTNIFFTVDVDAAGGELYAGQCTIADPDAFSLAAWYPVTAAGADHARSLVFDGYHVWLSSRLALNFADPNVPGLADFNLVNMVAGDYIGPLVYDGKFMYGGVLNFALGAGGSFALARFSPGRIIWDIPGGVLNTAATLGAGWWQFDPLDPTAGAVVKEWGPICFDGQDVWCFGERKDGEVMSGYLRRLPLVKFQ